MYLRILPCAVGLVDEGDTLAHVELPGAQTNQYRERKGVDRLVVKATLQQWFTSVSERELTPSICKRFVCTCCEWLLRR